MIIKHKGTEYKVHESLKGFSIKPTESSNVEWVGYDQVDDRLFVQFASGSSYIYRGIPKQAFYLENLSTPEQLREFCHSVGKIMRPYLFDKRMTKLVDENPF